mmetsp:Transcript_45002/g.84459  ORF Transcript_45002/g.84459 Transcript_45002/m.84459 type:complete len:808 (+) Transcript_45002:117-2540(+)
MQVRDIESSDGECFDEQGHAGRRHQSVPATGRRQQNAIVALPAYQQNPQASPTWGNAEDESNQLMDEHVLEAKLKAIAQAQLVYSQQALKAVKDACSELIRQKDSTIAQLQLEVQRLQNNRQHSAGGHNSGGTGESPGYTSAGVSSPFKKPQLAWHPDESSNNLRDEAKVHLAVFDSAPRAQVASAVEFPKSDVHTQSTVEAMVVQVEKKPKLEKKSATVKFEPRASLFAGPEVSDKPQLGRGMTRRTSVQESAKKARQDAKSKGTSEEQQKAIQDGGQGVFIDAAAMKERVKEAIMRPEYNVMNYYKKSGCWQWIARNPWFENFTLCVIAFNALWIAIDTDRNKAPTLIVAHPVFIVAENFFCIYFTGELLIRFMAFKNKRDCLRDAWFVFDSCLVLMIVLDTWVMSAVLIITNKGSGAGLGDASILRLVRLLRLTRMARMARLLRAFPELMILVKGISVATRSVFFTLCLLAIIIYVFGVAFAQLSEDTPLESLYFASVPSAMSSLLLHGVLPDLHEFVNKVGDEHLAFSVLLLFFILLSSLTVMNMLVGVLVEVVSVVSSVEKEQMTVQFVKTMILSMLQNSGLDADNNCHISRQEFESLLLKPEAARIIQEVGVDVVGLVDFADFIFKDDVELSFPELMEIVLQLRGCNTATVRDIVDLRKFVLTEIHSAIADISCTVAEKVEESISALQSPRSNEVSNKVEIYATAETTSSSKRLTRPGVNPDLPGSPMNTPVGSRANTRNPARRQGGLTMIGLHRARPAPNEHPLPDFPQHMWKNELEEDNGNENHYGDGGHRRAGRVYQR